MSNERIVNVSDCNRTDLYESDNNYEELFGPFGQLVTWGGGVAFECTFCIIIVMVFFLAIFILRKCNWNCLRFLSERFTGQPSQPLPPQPDFRLIEWIKEKWNWLLWDFDENTIGREGTIFLSFFIRIMKVLVVVTVFCIIFCILHYNSDKLGETVKTISSFTINNIGPNGTHSLLCVPVIFITIYLLKRHCEEFNIRAIVTPNIPPSDNIRNQRCLMISRILDPATITSDSFYEFLLSTIKMKGVSRSEIVFTYDTFIRGEKKEILEEMNNLEMIERVVAELNSFESLEEVHFRWWRNPIKFLKNKKVDAKNYYNGLKK